MNDDDRLAKTRGHQFALVGSSNPTLVVMAPPALTLNDTWAPFCNYFCGYSAGSREITEQTENDPGLEFHPCELFFKAVRSPLL